MCFVASWSLLNLIVLIVAAAQSSTMICRCRAECLKWSSPNSPSRHVELNDLCELYDKHCYSVLVSVEWPFFKFKASNCDRMAVNTSRKKSVDDSEHFSQLWFPCLIDDLSTETIPTFVPPRFSLHVAPRCSMQINSLNFFLSSTLPSWLLSTFFLSSWVEKDENHSMRTNFFPFNSTFFLCFQEKKNTALQWKKYLKLIFFLEILKRILTRNIDVMCDKTDRVVSRLPRVSK